MKKIINKIKSFRLTKQNFSFVGAVICAVALLTFSVIVYGIPAAVGLTVGLITAIIVLVKLVPWIESKLPDEKDK